jgi:hypothetical protein
VAGQRQHWLVLDDSRELRFTLGMSVSQLSQAADDAVALGLLRVEASGFSVLLTAPPESMPPEDTSVTGA